VGSDWKSVHVGDKVCVNGDIKHATMILCHGLDKVCFDRDSEHVSRKILCSMLGI
jgi:hypothetical protein